MIRLEPLTRFNWETAIRLSVSEDQQPFIPSNLFSIAQSRFEDSEPFLIVHDEEPVGFLLIVRFSGVYWITRIMIDQFYQGRGYGPIALQKAVDLLKQRKGVDEIRTSVARKNLEAENLFLQAGFRRLQEVDGKEFVMRLEWVPGQAQP